ncbi:SAM-dependent methyltransferase [Streptomyces nitrosporeus]|uniref:SAM-dependent methyltransferase n=1 Tax=Streptomyces nitrosporeus TaxID=28894 RepID=UPI0039A381F0
MADDHNDAVTKGCACAADSSPADRPRSGAGGRPVLNDGSRGIGAAHERAQNAYDDTGAIPYFLRPVDRIAAFFDGLELLEPGVAPAPFRWPRTSGKSREPAAS